MDLQTPLERARTIAVVGCSPRAFQTSHRIARYLLEVGYTVVPVNPYHDEILGQPCYPDLQHIPAEVEVDIVNVFRRPQFTEGVVQDTIERMEATGQRPLIWTQIGVHSQPAARLAEAHGLPYVANRCIMVEHARMA